MTFPTDIGVIDTMVGTRAGGSQQYAFLKGALRDGGSEKMQFPAEYMFKDVPYKGQADGEAPQGADLLLPHMDHHHIDIAMIGVSEANEPAMAALANHPDRFVGCWSIDPNKGMAGIRDLVAAHERWGIVAATCFPAGFQPQVAINHARMYPFYAKCIELDIPIFVNAGVPGPRVPMACQSVEHFDEICYEFPELRIVMRHGAEPDTALAVKLMLKWPNLYYSTSAFAPRYYPADIVRYANSRGGDKVLYAGYFPMGLSYERIFDELPSVPFNDDVWPKFLRTNAQKVLGLRS